MSIIEKLRHLKKSLSPHRPLIEIFVYKDHLLHNLKQYQKQYPRLQFAPVLKANAYGHGLEAVLSVLKNQTLPFVCVDSHFELRIAQKYAPNLPALVIGFSRLESILESKPRQASFAIISFDQLKELSAKLKNARHFHLKIDAGMHRQGVLPDAFGASVNLIRANSNIILDGLCGHLADPDNEIETLKQIENWNRAVKYFKKEFPKIKYAHLSATGGVKHSAKIDANAVRLGIGFYGIPVDSSPLPVRRSFSEGGKGEGREGVMNLKPALEMRSIITGIKTIEVGEKIGYGFTYEAKQKMKIATVPAGFFEGVDRRLSSSSNSYQDLGIEPSSRHFARIPRGVLEVRRAVPQQNNEEIGQSHFSGSGSARPEKWRCISSGYFKIGQNFCPIVGRVSMNISTIDITDAPSVAYGEEAIIISSQPQDKNSIQNIANSCSAIPYEILVRLPQHLRRTII